MGTVVHAAPAGFRQFHADFRFTVSLLAVLRAVQRHRALCAGGIRLEAELPATQVAVSLAIERALKACPPEGSSSEASGDQAFVETLAEVWQQMLASRHMGSDEMLFLRHCRLLERVLERIGRLADEWAGLDRERDRLVSAYSRQLPALTEALGRIRGLCCGIAAIGHCSPFKRTRLFFQCSSAEALLVAANQRYRETAPPIEALVARTAAERLVHVVRAEFLRERVDYPVDDFYRLATEAIDTVFVWIDRVGDDLMGKA
ncbi:MAG: hypothetical protein JSS57_26570 [Proteobacteria bacterium]|nr:hypothetical protein [Pseudomonadota bacterium]